MTEPETLTTITATVARIGRIPSPAPEADFYLAGFGSTDALELLVELEERFNVSIPDDRFIAARSAQDLAVLVRDLQQPPP